MKESGSCSEEKNICPGCIAGEGAFAEKRTVTYKVADDARWHICLKEKCIDEKGVAGFRTVNEYAQFGDYGIPHKSYSILLDITGDTATALEVQIITKIH